MAVDALTADALTAVVTAPGSTVQDAPSDDPDAATM